MMLSRKADFGFASARHALAYQRWEESCSVVRIQWSATSKRAVSGGSQRATNPANHVCGETDAGSAAHRTPAGHPG